MALTPPAFFQDLMTARAMAPFPLLGANFDRLAQAVSFAIPSWAVGQQTNLALTGVAAGNTGAGTINPVTTRLFIVPNVPAMLAGLHSAGMKGPMAQSLATIMAIGIATTFSKIGQYAGTAAGVGVGTDSSKISKANVATLTTTLEVFMATFMGPGPANTMMAEGIARGVTDMLKSGTGVGMVVGTPAPYPGSGPTNSVVV